MPAVAPSGHPRAPGADKTVKLKPLPPAADGDEETTTDDDSSDEEAAFEMDGQELWTQTYCATCDCLIEPGEGLASKDDEAESTKTPHTSLKSRSGTIKARTSDGGAAEPHPQTSKETATSNANSHQHQNNKGADMKRTHSAGRLHARGGNGALGPNKRTGSAASRLNALSELRPTTKLHPTQDDKGKGKVNPAEGAGGAMKGQGRRSPTISRRGSITSVKSLNHSSGPSSVKSDEATASTTGTKPKSRGFLGGLTPAALKQQQAEMAEKKKAPAQLYCSERCRAIDERRSAGLGELTQYLSQPLQPAASAAWVNQGWPVVPGLAASQWPRSASLTSVALPYISGTPESECMCPECMDKYADGGSAGGATVPSGASDTTESSSGHMYGRPGAGPKARTASGRIMTPLNLHGPGSAGDSYFPIVGQVQNQASAQAQAHIHRNSMSGSRSRQTEGVAFDAEKRRSAHVPARTPSAGPVGSASTADTESSSSNASLWEPKLRRPSDARGSGTIKRTSFAAGSARAGDRNELDVADVADPGHVKHDSGQITVTATPAITPRQSMVQPSLPGRTNSRHAHTLSVPAAAFRDVASGTRTRRSTDANDTRQLSASMKTAASLATSPLNLLQRSSHHYAAPSVDVWNEHVGSPTARGSFLSRSLASENTLMGSSGITVSGLDSQPVSQSQHSRHLRGTSSSSTKPDKRASVANVDAAAHGMGRTSSHDARVRQQGEPGSLNDLSLAVDSLKLAQSRAFLRRESSNSIDGEASRTRRLSLFAPITAPERRHSTARSVSSSGSGSNSGWFRSISSAWATLRGAPSDHDRVDDDLESGAAIADGDLDYQRPGIRDRRVSSSSRGSDQFRIPALPSRLSQGTMGSSSASASSRQQAAAGQPATSQDQGQTRDLTETATPTQSLVAKPTIRRGRVPAFVQEIGHGEIPGDATEAAAYAQADPGSYRSTSAVVVASPQFRSREGSFSRVQGMTDEEKERRRKERKEANRQRRSRDIHVLPPLLAPSSRNSSSSNLYGNMPRSARAASHGRPRTHSYAPQMVVGSAGSNTQVPPLQRSTTPGAPSHPHGPPSPAYTRSPFQGAFPLMSDNRGMISPARPGSAAGFYNAGTSPRAKGLGWGAMTTIMPAPTPLMPPQPRAGHQHSTSIGYGHAAAVAASRTTHGQQALRHSHHHGHGQRGPHPVRHNTSLQLGTVGLLGGHPHGHAPVAGRHSTMPSMLQRTPTPSVPEDGGEMTSHDLTSGDFIARPNSAMSQVHRHRSSMMPPPRSRSSMGIHAVGGYPHAGADPSFTSAEPIGAGLDPGAAAALHRQQPSDRTWSYEALPGLKTYPVLQMPNREAHDIYDPGWGLDSGGLAKHLTGKPLREEEPEGINVPGREPDAGQQGTRYAPTHRKKLFYFDA